MGVLLSLYLYSIFVPYFDLYFLLLWLPSLNHLAFYGAKVWRFCQIPNTRRCLIRLKLFRNAFHKCCTFGFSKKLSTELLGVLTLMNHHLFMHVKRLYDDEVLLKFWYIYVSKFEETFICKREIDALPPIIRFAVFILLTEPSRIPLFNLLAIELLMAE